MTDSLLPSKNFDGSNTIIGVDGWYGDDTQVIAVTTPTNTSPLSGDVTDVLHLEAGGGILTNLFSQIQTNTYLDMVVQMNPSDLLPSAITNSGLSQFAVYMNSSSNLVIYHSSTDGSNGGVSNKFTTLTNVVVAAGEWIRLTTMMDVVSGHGGGLFTEKCNLLTLWINGTKVTNRYAYTAPYSTPASDLASTDDSTGSLFIVANSTTSYLTPYMSEFNLSGAGMFDDISATTTIPVLYLPQCTPSPLSTL